MRLGPAGAIVTAIVLLSLGWLVAAFTGTRDDFERLVWSEDAPWFGGFSAIEVLDGGTGFVAVTDSAILVEGELDRAQGRLVSTDVRGVTPLADETGARLRPKAQDAEGMARLEDGTLFVSFEMLHRILRYDRPGAPGIAVDPRPDFERFRPNASLEALAAGADGTLYAMAEAPRLLIFTHRVWRLRPGGRWEPVVELPRGLGYRAVSADIGPDGRFYLLERRLTPLGFQSRLRSWRIGDGGAADMREIFRSHPGQHDNLEGLSVWRRADGQLVATLISDDNFLAVQETEIVEYPVAE